MIRRRYRAGMQNWWRDYRPLLDHWILFDNSGREPRAIALEEKANLHLMDGNRYAAIIGKLAQ